jgi:hypothetical protein
MLHRSRRSRPRFSRCRRQSSKEPATPKEKGLTFVSPFYCPPAKVLIRRPELECQLHDIGYPFRIGSARPRRLESNVRNHLEHGC